MLYFKVNKIYKTVIKQFETIYKIALYYNIKTFSICITFSVFLIFCCFTIAFVTNNFMSFRCGRVESNKQQPKVIDNQVVIVLIKRYQFLIISDLHFWYQVPLQSPCQVLNQSGTSSNLTRHLVYQIIPLFPKIMICICLSFMLTFVVIPNAQRYINPRE